MNLPGYDAWKTTEPDEPQWQTPDSMRKVRVCIECGGVATHALNGWRYCWDHYREQATVVMGLMQQQRDDEREGK